MDRFSSHTIGIDCRFAATQSGIGRYTRELVRALLKRNDPWGYVLFVNTPSGLENILPHARGQIAEARGQTYSLWEQFEMPHAIRQSGVSLMHFPHFNAPLLCPAPLVATIHDLILHRFPNEASFGKRLAYRFLMGTTVRRSKHIIAVSNATKRDLVEQYPSLFSSSGEENTKRISVIHEGISAKFFPRTKEEQQSVLTEHNLSSKSFVLYVGAAKEHKNVQMLIDACPEELTLVLITGGKEVSRLRLRPNVRVLSNVPDADIPALYSAASAYVSPALAEGFNFPVLEALACGCPVIATNRGATPEILGRFGTLVEPTVEGLAQGMREAASGKRLAAGDSIEHARSFTWEKAAEETAKLYAGVLQQVYSSHGLPRRPPPERPPETRHQGRGDRRSHCALRDPVAPRTSPGFPGGD